MMRPSVKVFCSFICSSDQPAAYSLGKTYLRQVSASVRRAICLGSYCQASIIARVSFSQQLSFRAGARGGGTPVAGTVEPQLPRLGCPGKDRLALLQLQIHQLNLRVAPVPVGGDVLQGHTNGLGLARANRRAAQVHQIGIAAHLVPVSYTHLR